MNEKNNKDKDKEGEEMRVLPEYRSRISGFSRDSLGRSLHSFHK